MLALGRWRHSCCAQRTKQLPCSRRVLHVDIRVEVSRKAQSVLTSPSGRRSDAVVVDCEDEVSALPLIAHFRQYPRSAMRRDCAGQKPGACEARCLLTALQLSPLQTGLSRRALGTGRVGIRLLVGGGCVSRGFERAQPLDLERHQFGWMLRGNPRAFSARNGPHHCGTNRRRQIVRGRKSRKHASRIRHGGTLRARK